MSTAKKPGARPSQDFVPIEQVRDGVVVLKDGGLRAVLMTSSLNMALKSHDEQLAILGQFQNFLNSLDFTVQFFVQSRELDIRPYLALLEERYKMQTGELMKIQVREYIDFVKGFTESANIMSKSFFVVVPYTPSVISGADGGISGIMGSLLGKKGNTNATEKAALAFEENRSQLEQRVSVVQSGLTRCGIRGVQLGTEEVIELFYKMFNIGELDRPLPPDQVRQASQS